MSFDKDFDHILNKEEFYSFLRYLIPKLSDEECLEIFKRTDYLKDNKITFPEFKQYFPDIIQNTRITNVLDEISKII